MVTFKNQAIAQAVATPLTPFKNVIDVLSDVSEKKTKDIKDYPYTPKEWIGKFLNIDNSYIDEMFDYFRKQLVSFFIEKSEFTTTHYREYLKLCVSDKIFLNDNAEYIDISDSTTLENPDSFYWDISKTKSLSGFLRFLILHYEEDKLIDNVSKKYNIENKSINKLLKLKNYPKEVTTKSFFELMDQKLHTKEYDEYEEYKTFNVVETIFSYNYRKKAYLLAVGEHKSAHFVFKCSTNMDNPALKYIQNYFENGSFVINIISSNHKTVTNLNGFDMLVLDNGSWYLP